ncbi:MAG: hypothetical protein QM539_02010 [Alphaproteobacteria bacterium]|nr:hypothetical protein [Alphaproteobacteria bacterium]
MAYRSAAKPCKARPEPFVACEGNAQNIIFFKNSHLITKKKFLSIKV